LFTAVIREQLTIFIVQLINCHNLGTKMKKILFFILLLSTVFSQTPGISQGFGFAAGMQSGNGFSYRDIGENNGFQFTIGVIGRGDDSDNSFPEERTDFYKNGWIPNTDEIYYEQSYDNSYFWGNLGFLYIKPLHRVEKSMFYWFGGISTQVNYEKSYERQYKYFEESETEYTYKPIDDERVIKESELRIFGGLGLGISYNVTKHITFSFELPLTVSDEGDIWMIVPQGAVHYFYK